ncbi:MAG: M23 family metallopeptidase [Verrucomicrobia bacterium]|nr:MAG: M23 family metallopeptidase [Verrucomicrobiota bacterium]
MPVLKISQISPPLALVTLFLTVVPCACLAQTISKTADGFDLPVAPPAGTGFYKSRGFRSGGHLGEDWVTDGGSAKGFRQPVHTIGNGIVVLARDIHVAWGNVVMIRHSWIENRQIHFADSLYAHLDRINVREGQQVGKGQQIGAIGTNHGMYPPHLHFEIHKDLGIGVNHAAGTRDLRSYWLPTEFVMARRHLAGGGRNVPTPVANFLLPTTEHPWNLGHFWHSPKKKSTHPKSSKSSLSHHSTSTAQKHTSSNTWKINHYSDP